MSNISFKAQIREKITDSNLQSALDVNVEWCMGRAADLRDDLMPLLRLGAEAPAGYWSPAPAGPLTSK